MNDGVLDYRDRVLRVVDFVERHIDRQLSLEELAEQACFSPFHFHRIFTACMGEGPLEYFRRVRVEKAALALVYHRERTVTDIAFEFGFSSPEVFVRAFRRQLKVSPGVYRRDPLAALRQLPARVPLDLPDPTAPDPLVLDLVESPAIDALAAWSWNGYGNHLFSLWEDLCGRAHSLGLMGDGCRLFGLSLDDPMLTPASRCRYVACVAPPPAVPLPRRLPAGLTRQHLDGGWFAQLRIGGAIEDIQNAYRWFYLVWLNGAGRGWEPLNCPPREFYLGSGSGKTIAIQFPVRRV